MLAAVQQTCRRWSQNACSWVSVDDHTQRAVRRCREPSRRVRSTPAAQRRGEAPQWVLAVKHSAAAAGAMSGSRVPPELIRAAITPLIQLAIQARSLLHSSHCHAFSCCCCCCCCCCDDVDDVDQTRPALQYSCTPLWNIPRTKRLKFITNLLSYSQNIAMHFL